MKNLVIVGSTGSVGRSTIDVVEQYPEKLNVLALAAGRNSERLLRQVERHGPKAVALGSAMPDDTLVSLCRRIGCELYHGPDGVASLAEIPEADIVVAAMIGAAGLRPSLAAARSGKRVALANKEVLVMAGELVMEEARRTGTQILPVDSEHNAIFQCLEGQKRKALRRILLCSSGIV